MTHPTRLSHVPGGGEKKKKKKKKGTKDKMRLP